MPRVFHLGVALQSALLCGLSVTCAAETSFNTNPTQFLVCDKGLGSYEGKLPDFSVSSGVTVSVRPTKRGGFASRGCEARLKWKGGETILGSGLAQADIDVMGADLGFGVPVVAFQIKATDADPTIRYDIYSLSKPPKLLHTIIGQDYFSAADSRLDGTVQIWTTDSAAVNGFDNLPLRLFDTPPAAVLRFEDSKLIDVSSEFRSHFDQQIRSLRSHLSDQQLSEFKASDGRLSSEHLAMDRHSADLLATKVKVLEIVWAYLESGREKEAWDALNEMWPASDLNRVQSAIVIARKRGLHGQIDGVSQLTEPVARAGSAQLFANTISFGYDMPFWQRDKLADSGPEQILLRLPSPKDPEHWNDEKELELVIDEAGKVRSARMRGGIVKDISAGLRDEPNKEWVDLAASWKYIPAFKDGHPRAFRSKLHVLRDR